VLRLFRMEKIILGMNTIIRGCNTLQIEKQNMNRFFFIFIFLGSLQTDKYAVFLGSLSCLLDLLLCFSLVI
jgi:hypothetical protein